MLIFGIYILVYSCLGPSETYKPWNPMFSENPLKLSFQQYVRKILTKTYLTLPVLIVHLMENSFSVQGWWLTWQHLTCGRDHPICAITLSLSEWLSLSLSNRFGGAAMLGHNQIKANKHNITHIFCPKHSSLLLNVKWTQSHLPPYWSQQLSFCPSYINSHMYTF